MASPPSYPSRPPPVRKSRPPGAPRKQQSRTGYTGAYPAGPSSSSSSAAAAAAAAAAASSSNDPNSSSSSASSSGWALRHHELTAAYDAASSLFNDSPAGPSSIDPAAVDQGQQVREAPTWLSGRMLPPSDLEHQPAVSYNDTPTGRQPYSTISSAGAVAATGNNTGLTFRTPSAGAPPPNSSLYEQLARGMAASRRQQPSHARVSLASSSGWGSPRMTAPPNGALGGRGQRLSGDDFSTVSASGPSRLSSRGDANVFGVPRTPSAGLADLSVATRLRPPPVPRFSFPHNPAAAAVNQDGSYSVVRDGDDANNSGLLALSPAIIRRTNGLGFTPIHQDVTKYDGSTSGTKATSEVTSSSNNSGIERPDSNATMIEYVLDVETATPQDDRDELQVRRAQLLQSGGGARASLEEHSVLLDSMRNWREDAMKHHLYDTAIFWGDKILSLETDQIAWNDAYNLATAYFLTHRYAQAEHLLCTPLRIARPAEEPEREGAPREATEGNSSNTDSTASRAGRHRDAERDELGAALAATHRTSKMPPTMLARAHLSTDPRMSNSAESSSDEDCDDEAMEGEDNKVLLHRKRKDRPFTISGTGTASEGTSAGASNAGDLNGRASAARRHSDVNGTDDDHVTMQDKVTKAWREEQRLAMDEVRGSDLLPPDSVSLVSISIPCKYLAAQCMVRQGKYQEALDELSGWKGDRDDAQWTQSYKQPSKDGLIKLSSSIWHLKGLIQLHMRNVNEARESFMRSLSLDVKNYESFDHLIRGHLLSASEQWDFVERLEYVAQAGNDTAQVEALQVVRLLYLARLDKSGKLHAQQAAAARRQLVGLYGLGNNPDVLLGLAEEMFTRMRYEDAYAVTQRIMDLSKDHEAALPIHISSMHMIERLRPSLYLLAHHLTDTDPDMAAGWYAVGCWYFGAQRWLEARKYFSKCVQLDPRFAAGWIAFAHTFAHEGESDQAVVSYSTAERSFSAHYLVKLFLGMEHLAQGNLTLAELYLGGSAEVWEEDALSRNERGVAAYYGGRLDEAITLFRAALQAVRDVQQPPSAWLATHLNLGFALRKTGQLAAAKKSFLRVLELDPDVAQAYTGVGMCYHGQGDVDEAITWYHRALAVDATDKHANDLLAFALQESAQRMPHALIAAADRVIEEEAARKLAAKQRQSRNTPLNDAFGIRTDDSHQSAALNKHSPEVEDDGTREMTLAEGSASIDMDESY